MTFNLYKCDACKTAYAVSAKDPDIRLLVAVVGCPKWPCRGMIRLFATTGGVKVINAVKVKAIELFQAYQMGFKRERKCGPKDLKKIITGKKILSMDLDLGPDPAKSIIRSITIEGGKTIHLAPSTLGVVAIKVTES